MLFPPVLPGWSSGEISRKQAELSVNNCTWFTTKAQIFTTIKLFGCFYYRLLVMWRPNWMYSLIDRLPERLPMCHRSENCRRHRGFTALSVHVAMVTYLQCCHAHQSAPCWRRIDQDLPLGILSVIIWLQRQTLCDTWGWGGAHPGSDAADPLHQHHIPEVPGACCHSACPGAALSLVVSVGMQGQERLTVPPRGNSYAVIALCVCWEAMEVVEWE